MIRQRKPIKRKNWLRRSSKPIKARKSKKKGIKRAITKVVTRKKLMKQAEEAWKAAVKRRDKTCRIPGCLETKVLQVDHCFSRAIKQLFLDPRNGTLLCSGHHMMKTFGIKSTDRRVDELVKMREGPDWWANALDISMKGKPYKHSIEELETTIHYLNAYATDQ